MKTFITFASRDVCTVANFNKLQKQCHIQQRTTPSYQSTPLSHIHTRRSIVTKSCKPNNKVVREEQHRLAAKRQTPSRQNNTNIRAKMSKSTRWRTSTKSGSGSCGRPCANAAACARIGHRHPQHTHTHTSTCRSSISICRRSPIAHTLTCERDVDTRCRSTRWSMHRSNNKIHQHSTFFSSRHETNELKRITLFAVMDVNAATCNCSNVT